MSEQTDTQQTETTSEASEQAAPDYTALMGRMDELSQTVKSLVPEQEPSQGLSEGFYGRQDGQGEEWDQQWDQQGYEAGQYQDQFEGMDPQAQQRAAMEEANRLIDARVQEQLRPYQQEQQRRENLAQAKELERQYPDLQKGEVVKEVMREAQARAQMAGQPELIRNPAFIELVYLAQQAQTNASQQTAADGGSEAHLEGEGAVPDAPEDDFAQRVVNAGNTQGQGAYKWF